MPNGKGPSSHSALSPFDALSGDEAMRRCGYGRVQPWSGVTPLRRNPPPPRAVPGQAVPAAAAANAPAMQHRQKQCTRCVREHLQGEVHKLPHGYRKYFQTR